MRRLFAYFLRGLVLIAPLVVTVYACWLIFVTVDGWLGLPIPGVGFLATVALITIIGFLASTLLTRTMTWLVEVMERALIRLPFVRLLYTSTKDLLNAFVGEKRRFDRPVSVALTADGHVQALGFVTQPSLAELGMAEHVAVYLPQSYNFAGNLIVVPAAAVRPLVADSADVMAFIVSGAVTSVRRPGASVV